MLVNIVQVPNIKEGKDSEVRQWFRGFRPGLRQSSRLHPPVLLQPREGGTMSPLSTKL
jgi:hypothetical protein